MECRECGHEDCPCDECHGEGGFTVDRWSHQRDCHYQIEVECATCALDAERGRADDQNQLRAEDEALFG